MLVMMMMIRRRKRRRRIDCWVFENITKQPVHKTKLKGGRAPLQSSNNEVCFKAGLLSLGGSGDEGAGRQQYGECG